MAKATSTEPAASDDFDVILREWDIAVDDAVTDESAGTDPTLSSHLPAGLAAASSLGHQPARAGQVKPVRHHKRSIDPTYLPPRRPRKKIPTPWDNDLRRVALTHSLRSRHWANHDGSSTHDDDDGNTHHVAGDPAPEDAAKDAASTGHAAPAATTSHTEAAHSKATSPPPRGRPTIPVTSPLQALLDVAAREAAGHQQPQPADQQQADAAVPADETGTHLDKDMADSPEDGDDHLVIVDDADDVDADDVAAHDDQEGHLHAGPLHVLDLSQNVQATLISGLNTTDEHPAAAATDDAAAGHAHAATRLPTSHQHAAVGAVPPPAHNSGPFVTAWTPQLQLRPPPRQPDGLPATRADLHLLGSRPSGHLGAAPGSAGGQQMPQHCPVLRPGQPPQSEHGGPTPLRRHGLPASDERPADLPAVQQQQRQRSRHPATPGAVVALPQHPLPPVSRGEQYAPAPALFGRVNNTYVSLLHASKRQAYKILCAHLNAENPSHPLHPDHTNNRNNPAYNVFSQLYHLHAVDRSLGWHELRKFMSLPRNPSHWSEEDLTPLMHNIFRGRRLHITYNQSIITPDPINSYANTWTGVSPIQWTQPPTHDDMGETNVAQYHYHNLLAHRFFVYWDKDHHSHHQDLVPNLAANEGVFNYTTYKAKFFTPAPILRNRITQLPAVISNCAKQMLVALNRHKKQPILDSSKNQHQAIAAVYYWSHADPHLATKAFLDMFHTGIITPEYLHVACIEGPAHSQAAPLNALRQGSYLGSLMIKVTHIATARGVVPVPLMYFTYLAHNRKKYMLRPSEYNIAGGDNVACHPIAQPNQNHVNAAYHIGVLM